MKTTGTAIVLFAALAAGAAAADATRSTEERPSEIWGDVRGMVFGDAEIRDGEAMIEIDAPYRAHDAALVPVAVRIAPESGRKVARMTLIVDENPSPVAAEFEFFDGMDENVALSTRLRVNAYSNVRVVAELDDGSLWQSARFVKAAGGCSAPASKDAEAALAALGRMKLRRFGAPEDAPDRREAQVMIRHPNNSGFQVDQITQLYVPAFFIDEIVVSRGEAPLFRVVGGISISEDPTIRFEYQAAGEETLSVFATDIDGGEYRRSFPAGEGS